MTDAAAKIASRLEELWRTSRLSIRERVAAIRVAVSVLHADPGNAQARSSGREAAHKLSGILGVFGLPRGSELASEIEHILKSETALSPGDLSSLHPRLAELDAVIASKDGA